MTVETAKEAARRLCAKWIAMGYKPTALHEYCNADGQPIYSRFRLDHPDGDAAPEGRKIIRPMRQNGAGYELGEPQFDGGKPLYNLHRIAVDATSPVWIVEGEKAADALTMLGAIATTSGSATSAGDADWTPLRGRECRLWPDNDDAGRAYIRDVAAILHDLGCSMSEVDVESLGMEEKGDAFDWVMAHPAPTLADLEGIERRVASAASPEASEDHPAPPRPVASDLTSRRWPDAMDEAAKHGIAGEFLRMVEPNTEADPAAILVQFLVAFGALVGRGPHYRVEGDEHHANIFAVLVGATSKGRKGTSWGRVHDLFRRIPDWKPPVSGLSSGEGVKYHVRDASIRTTTGKVDEGVADKRLLVMESEFANALRGAQRQGNTLSATMRTAWETGNLRILTKNDPIVATDAHVSCIGHITAAELRAEMTKTDIANGFANRFLLVGVRRSKLLPFGGQVSEGDLDKFASRLGQCATLAQTRKRLHMSVDAETVWAKVYPSLSEGGIGLHGAITARAEAHVLRLALIYALLDRADSIGASHLRAALAVWTYCDDTVKYVFGGAFGDANADRIMAALVATPAGLTRTEISEGIFNRNVEASAIETALDLLRSSGRAQQTNVSTDGRPREVWTTSR